MPLADAARAVNVSFANRSMYGVGNDEVTAAELWDEATAEVVSRVRKPRLPGESGNADVRFCYIDQPKLA